LTIENYTPIHIYRIDITQPISIQRTVELKKMKYSETDLTEATKIISYLRSMRIYAVAIFFSGLLYLGLKIHNNTKGTELYLLYCFTGIIILGSLSIIIRLNYKTANIYGLSCIIAGVIYSFSILYYRGETPGFFTAIGSVVGLIVIRQGVSVAFGNRSQEAFSRVNQKKVSFVKNLLKSLKQSLPDEKNVIHCTFADDKGEKRDLSIKLLDDVACFLLNGHSTPIFFDCNNVYISELQGNRNFLNVSINVDNHDWLEAQFKPDDFKKYQAWKDL
jgi:hypothetical protein